jgi:uncharacterized protein YkwD
MRRRTALVAIVLSLSSFLMTTALAPEPLFRGKPTISRGEQISKLLELTNRERISFGSAPLTLSEALNQSAQNHAQDLALHNFVSHTGSDGSSIGSRADRANYSWRTLGENIYRGVNSSPERAIAGWMRSAGHRRNLLDRRFSEVGFGIAQRGVYTFFVQVLGRPF